LIKFSNVSIKKDKEVLLKNINLEIEDGEFVYIVGKSGAGKSTLLKLIYNEFKLDKKNGEIEVSGTKLSRLKANERPKLRRKIGVVFQDFKLLPEKTVYENVALAMEIIGKSDEEIKQRVSECLQTVDMTEKASELPDKLSGGEQQRVAIARAIANSPEIIVADEPTGNLDTENTWMTINLLDKINYQGITVIMVTHDREIVDTIRHRVIEIERAEVVRDEMKGEYGVEE
jgi:cell division transport system ATP-binding protein